MLNVSRLLQRSNLTGKERIRILIADIINTFKGEKPILTEADKKALRNGLYLLKDSERDEYNKYVNGWKTACLLEYEAETCYLKAKIAFQASTYLLKDFIYYPEYRTVRNALGELKKIKRVSIGELGEIVERAKQQKLKGGCDYFGENIALTLAYEISDKATQKEFNEIVEEGLENYLDEELTLSELYKTKDYETIAENASKQFYNDRAKLNMLTLDYGGIKTYELAKQTAKDNSLPFTETRQDRTDETNLIELLKEYAQKHKTTPEAMLKATCLKMLKEGAYKDAIEVYDSNLFKKWTEAKGKAKDILKDLIDKGELKTIIEDGQTKITNESLYKCKADYKFIEGFKDHINTYKPYDGKLQDDKGQPLDTELLLTNGFNVRGLKTQLMIAESWLSTLSIIKETEEKGKKFIDIDSDEWKKMFLEDKKMLINKYEHLLAIDEIYNRLSKLYELEIGYKVKEYLQKTKGLIELFNNFILEAIKKTKAEWQDEDIDFKDKSLFIDIEKCKPNAKPYDFFIKEFTNTFGKEF